MADSRIYRPMTKPDDWQSLLAQPELQWKTGFSGRTLAHCWHDERCDRGLPPELREAFDRVERLRGLEVLVALPEHKVPLPGGRRASQSDIWFLGRTQNELVSVAVEGKVNEDFGPLVSEWLGDADDRSGKGQRLAAIKEILGLGELHVSAVRYQLLHRTASAILEARRFHAKVAVMLVHAFGKNSHFDQFAAFAEAVGGHAESGLFSVSKPRDITLYLGWVEGDDRWMKA
jgi:hypothetical protein